MQLTIQCKNIRFLGVTTAQMKAHTHNEPMRSLIGQILWKDCVSTTCCIERICLLCLNERKHPAVCVVPLASCGGALHIKLNYAVGSSETALVSFFIAHFSV